MSEEEVITKQRTLRRRQRSQFLADYSSDLRKIQTLREQAEEARKKDLFVAYDKLYDIIYKAYLEVLDSEV